ncbi:chloride channel protein [Neptunomonas antarctica]|uniref:Chloride channel protein, CIC family n=1 Tax=Neptunomonas antarctica TaxID=619304 RepID=A0A1N7PLS4_9GAMM|nr:chloride channel protein [Neptunomonas antarctica]SIT11594.1 chloride channel protein, CIC family [Neptunomonas antarctica]
MQKHHLSLQYFRERLAHYDALPQLVILGLLSGVMTGLLMVLFRLAMELPLTYLLGHPDNFEALSSQQQFLWPIIGSSVLILIFYLWPQTAKQIGMVNLFERLAYHQGRIPGKSIIMQFVTAAIALSSGHSAGREGPSIFLGAACSSLIGQRLQLPNNSLRLLIGCGAAAAISAAFNTPLAGVIFAMEVILMEYTIIGFTPIIVAAVSADLVMRSILGHDNVFDVPLFHINTLAEVPWVMLLGVVVGLCAATFNRIMLFAYKVKHWPVAIRFLLAGLITGIAATAYPQIMGVGYDTISEALWGRLDLQLLCGLLLIKLLITPLILGLGIPAGLIGPTLFIGAIIGAIFGVIGGWFTDMPVSHIGLYAMLGMGAMMGAVLNAPLAALVALLELTGNTNIIFPGMIAIVISNLTVRYFFNLPSIFLSSLQAQGLDYRQEPIAQALSRAAAGSLMETSFITTALSLSTTAAQEILAKKPRWILLQDVGQAAKSLMLPTDLQSYLARDETPEQINLLDIPAERLNIVEISFRATLYEALQKLNEQHISTLCVTSNKGDIMGVLTRAQIEYYYTHKQTL